MFSLNIVGSTILDLLEQGWDEVRIAQEISLAYAISVEVARADVHDFIESLSKHHILAADSSVEPMRGNNQG